VGFFIEDSILVAINCGVKACVEGLARRKIGGKGTLTGSEDVLVVLCKHTIGNYVTVVRRLSWIDVDDRNDTSCANLKRDTASGI
jgi:hypothetical protein